MTTVGLLHPGAMGASVGAAAKKAGSKVLWLPAGRSDASRERAERAGLTPSPSLDDLLQDSEVVISVCPPHAADNLAATVAAAGFNGVFVEGNAISPDRTRRIATQFGDGTFVDGGIIGGPAWRAEANTRFYLSGAQASRVSALFEGSPLSAPVISEEAGAASALKMTFAAYTKGSTALLTAILAVAEREGVRGDLEQQWGTQFTAETHQRVLANTAKAWRFAGEMTEISETFSGAGLPGGFHEAAAAIFGSLSEFKDKPAESIETMLTALSDAEIE